MNYENGIIHFTPFWGMVFIATVLGIFAIFYLRGISKQRKELAARGRYHPAQPWLDEDLPGDELLRVMGGNSPTWKFRLWWLWRRIWMGFLSLVVTLVPLVILFFIFGGFAGSDRWLALGMCVTSFVGGIFVGARSTKLPN